jgi:hypothetical protein
MNAPAKDEDLSATPDKPISKDTVLQRIREMDPKRWGKYTKSQMLNDPVAAAAAQKLFGGETAPAGVGQDQQALAWARANPGDPRAKMILNRLGADTEE